MTGGADYAGSNDQDCNAMMRIDTWTKPPNGVTSHIAWLTAKHEGYGAEASFNLQFNFTLFIN
jgi:hypothetical protein